MIYNKPIDQIELADLEALISQGSTESKHLEFKEELNLANKQDKSKHRLEFLKDVSCFANAGGGLLIYGLAENEDGEAHDLVGLANQTSDGLKLQVDSIITEGIEPRIAGLGCDTVELQNQNLILLIKIPKSWNSPHMVCHNHNSKFYTRTSSGAIQMDVNQIRDMFLQGQTIVEKMRSFREERVQAISEETDKPKLILHIIPIQNIAEQKQLDLQQILQSKPSTLCPISFSVGGLSPSFNFQGVILHSGMQNFSNLQLFRTGALEFLESEDFDLYSDHKGIFLSYIEGKIIKGLQQSIDVFHSLQIQPPYALYISLDEVKDMRLSELPLWNNSPNLINQAQLLCPEVIIEQVETDTQTLATLLHPTFNTLWNAGGHPSSISYEQDGTYNLKTRY